MSTIGWLLSLAGDVVAAGWRQAVKAKRLVLPPKLDGPMHTFPRLPEGFPDNMPIGVSYYMLHICRKCEQYVERRAAFTTPPCRERPPSVIVELG